MPVLSEAPVNKERILNLLPLVGGLTEKWSDYAIDEGDGRVDHYFGSTNLMARATVLENTLTITVAQRDTRKVTASRRFGWISNEPRAPLTVLVAVTRVELQALASQCKATEQLSVKAAFKLWLTLDGLSRMGKRDQLFGSAERFSEVLASICTAAMLKLEVKFEV